MLHGAVLNEHLLLLFFMHFAPRLYAWFALCIQFAYRYIEDGKLGTYTV